MIHHWWSCLIWFFQKWFCLQLFRQFCTAKFEQLWFESFWLLCFHIGSSFLQLVIFKKRLNNINIASSYQLQAICLNIIKKYHVIFKKFETHVGSSSLNRFLGTGEESKTAPEIIINWLSLQGCTVHVRIVNYSNLLWDDTRNHAQLGVEMKFFECRQKCRGERLLIGESDFGISLTSCRCNVKTVT